MTTDPTTALEGVIRTAVSETVKLESEGFEVEPSYRPPIDLKDTPQELVAYIDIPGLDEDELKFTWKPDLLTISGGREFDHDAEDAEEFVQIQRVFGSFLCRIPLNDTLDIDRASAKYRRGVLKIRIPKRRQQQRHHRE